MNTETLSYYNRNIEDIYRRLENDRLRILERLKTDINYLYVSDLLNIARELAEMATQLERLRATSDIIDVITTLQKRDEVISKGTNV